MYQVHVPGTKCTPDTSTKYQRCIFHFSTMHRVPWVLSTKWQNCPVIHMSMLLKTLGKICSRKRKKKRSHRCQPTTTTTKRRSHQSILFQIYLVVVNTTMASESLAFNFSLYVLDNNSTEPVVAAYLKCKISCSDSAYTDATCTLPT